MQKKILQNDEIKTDSNTLCTKKKDKEQSNLQIQNKSKYGDTLFFQVEEEIATPVGGIGKFTPCLEVLPKYPSIVFYGKRRTGKSFGVRDLCYNCFRHIPFGIFFMNLYFSNFINF